MSVESRPNKLTKGLVLDTFHTDVDNTVATYALNSQLEDQEGNHFHYGSEVGTTYIKDIPANHVVVGHINMERNETVLFTTDGTNSTIGILSRKDDMSYNYEIKVDDSKQEKKLGFKKEGYVRGVYRLLNGCDKVIYFVDGINKDRRININQLDSYKLPTTASVASGIIFDDSLRATIYALSSATGNIQLIRLLSASPEATANVLATLTSGAELTKLLTASANGMGTAFANLIRTANIVSSIEATGTSTVNVDIVRLLESNVSAIGSVNAILQSSQQGIVEIDVTLTGVASSTAILLRSALLEVNLTTEASTVTTAILTRIISAQSQALADTSATAQITIPVNATANATATTAADAILSYAVNATANAIANTEATSQLSKVITASVDAVANSSSEALIGLVLVSTTTANGSVSTADLYINRLLTSSVTAQGITTAEALIAKLLESSTSATANNTTTDLLVSKLLASTVSGLGNVTANLQLADLLSTALSGTATTEAVLEAINLLIGDPYIDNVSLLLQGDDNPSGVTQNNTFKDSSGTITTITPNGNVTQGTFSPFDRALTNSGGSAYFDGTGDYLTVAANSAFSFNSNFTIECWINATSLSTSISLFIINIGNGTYFALNPGTSSIDIYLNSATPSFNATCTISLNTWTHIALVRSSNIVRVYINGVVLTNTVTNSSTLGSSTNPLVVCGLTGGFNGYISNLRVVKGTAVYTSNFQPSTIPLTAITNTSLLLNFTNAAIFDGVKLNNIETVGGAQINTSIKQFGTGSLAFDGNGDYLTTPINSNLEFGTGDFTIETWIRFNTLVDSWIVGIGQGAAAGIFCGWYLRYNNNNLTLYRYDGTTETQLSRSWTPSINTWYHLAVTRSGTSVRLFVDGSQLGTTITSSLSFNKINNDNLQIGFARTGTGSTFNYVDGYIDDLRITKGIARYTGATLTVPTNKLSSLIPNYLVSRSLRFNSADLTYLSRTPTVAGNRRTWTWSGWVKRGQLGTTNIIFSADVGVTEDTLTFTTNNTLFLYPSSNNNYGYITTNVFRDVSAWYHIVLAVDTTLSTSNDRVKIYVNGTQQSLTPSPAVVIQYYDWGINNTIQQLIGLVANGSTYFNGYMSEINFIDGQALTPDSFGIRNTSTGVWSPKEYTGTYGTNGFHLNFSDITQIGRDFSGNNNNWTPSGFSVTPGVGYDSLTDVPTPNGTDNGFGGEVRGNYATLNPLDKDSEAVLTNGNLVVTGGNDGGAATFAMTTGKWYWEITLTESFNAQYWGLHGISTGKNNSYICGIPGYPLGAGIFMRSVAGTNEGGLYSNGVKLQDYILFSTDKIFGFAFDADLRTLAIYDTGTLIRAAFSVPNGLMFPSYLMNGTTGVDTSTATYNFGQRPFTYQAPTGFKALNTANLPTPAIGGGGESNLANKYMDITTYTGTGAAQSISNSGFKPDFVWIKSRSGTTGHAIYDINRGVNKQLASNSDALEITNTSGLTSFDNTGFSIGTLGDINTNGATYVAWQWRAGGTPLTTSAGNTITSSVSVNSVSKFSITTYTGNGIAGATIAHALGVIPRMVIIKSITGAISNWAVYHGSLGNTSSLFLNTNGVSLTSNTYWNNTNPTANLISLGTSDLVNANTRNYVAYAWAEVDGYSKFSSYLGNNSTDGTFVYTGFKPKYILIKCITAATTNWVLYNSIVNVGNPVVNELFANTTNAENGTTSDEIDFLSNGFKLRSTNAAINAAQTYIYAAFAETPFKYATAGLTPEIKETVTVDYLVVAGGGGGGGEIGAGGGAGGYRTSFSTTGGGGSAESALTLNKGTSYTVTVGGGGNGGPAASINPKGESGTISVLASIEAAGGGFGGAQEGSANRSGGTGGSGGGAASSGTAGTRTSSPVQGNNGGSGSSSGNLGAGGGGGANATGANGTSSAGGNGGNGLASSITGISVTRAGGGGGGLYITGTAGSGGSGGGGNAGTVGSVDAAGQNGTDFTGGGGGGAFRRTDTVANWKAGGKGGKGVVIVRWLTSSATVTLAGGAETDAVSYTDGSYSIREIKNSGTVTFS